MADPVLFLSAVAGIFAVVNPLQNLTVFRYLTRGLSPAERHTVVVHCAVAGAVFLVTFVLLGDLIFRLYSISVPAFRIAGGILVLVIALKMLAGEPIRRPDTFHRDVGADPDEADAAAASEAKSSVGVTPLGIPLHAGPAAIGTVVLYASSATDLVDTGLVLAAIAVVFGLVYLVLRGADRMFETVGSAGLAVSSAIMALLLAAVAVQFVLDGIRQVLVTWGVLAAA